MRGGKGEEGTTTHTLLMHTRSAGCERGKRGGLQKRDDFLITVSRSIRHYNHKKPP